MYNTTYHWCRQVHVCWVAAICY